MLPESCQHSIDMYGMILNILGVYDQVVQEYNNEIIEHVRKQIIDHRLELWRRICHSKRTNKKLIMSVSTFESCFVCVI